MTAKLRPLALQRVGDNLQIRWSDGVTTQVSWRRLRENCPCAACVEERSKPPEPFRVLTPREIASGPPAPVEMTPVGHYAYQIVWNDGHATGIYTLERLRELGQPVAAQSFPPQSPSPEVPT